jgi:predicted RNA binding protein YcfA (HicA-like mRNA interferase family)
MPREEWFSVVRKLLESAGWKLVRINGLHHVFEKQGEGQFSVPVHHGKVKPWYVRQAQKYVRGNRPSV